MEDRDILGLATIALFALVRFHLASALPFATHFLSLLLVVLLRNILPPSALYLAASKPERLALLQQLQVRSIPTVTALLVVEARNGGALPQAFLSLIDFHTDGTASWEPIALQLIELAPLVLLDTRDITNALIFEALEIYTRDLAGPC